MDVYLSENASMFGKRDSGVSKVLFPKIASSTELVTSYEARRSGFVALALEKSRRATPFIEQARVLRETASLALQPRELLEISTIQPALLTAAGLSDKAIGHLEEKDKREAKVTLITQFLEPAGGSFVEELVFRFLLTRGDSLGGSMRNIGGAWAQAKLTQKLLASLSLAGISYRWLHGPSHKWLSDNQEDIGREYSLRGIAWSHRENPRMILFNFTVPLVKNNIDLCIMDCTPETLAPKSLLPECYLAFGELKGGIDPAGADEHWKTARTALARVRHAFGDASRTPHTFFVAAAIEKKMAEEIWQDLAQGILSGVANLTNETQLSALCHWIIQM